MKDEERMEDLDNDIVSHSHATDVGPVVITV